MQHGQPRNAISRMQQRSCQCQRIQHLGQLIERIQFDSAIEKLSIPIVMLELGNHRIQVASCTTQNRNAPRLEVKRVVTSIRQRHRQALLDHAPNAASLLHRMITASIVCSQDSRMPPNARSPRLFANGIRFNKGHIDSFAAQQAFVVRTRKKKIEDVIEI